ncbi:ABC transporter substrate-binding protein [Maritimibacter sp. HL-12]|jgi:iron(III) transport system substrate-binding protein|uniref:ABC transporter substrate-binding protein n=1 Tax=Maritimibacter sp. HL-12 TaxID=1162418 RepID=UPI000A0EF0C0|nr:ABC transporter substrate-binding protein [Maritimibacter sp. HL-12]SMH49774.1 iron(III) transport system substrate-binding protein [Maritimibacter sp. HL-12]
MLRTTLLAASLGLMTGAANAETLTVYTAGPGGLADALAEAFQAETGIAVELFQATTGKVMARLEAEESNPQADVVVSASWGSAEDMHARGLLMEYTSPNADTVPDFLKHSHYTAQGISALAMVWNSQSGVARPNEWADLTDEAYRDLITMPDPAQSGAAFDLVAGLEAAMGDEAWTLLAGLADNQMIVPGPNAAALNPVLQGAKAVVFGAVDYISYGRAAAGESIEVITPASGTVIAPRPIMILNSTDNADAAKAFVDFVLSEAGQALVSQTYLMPSRTDIEGLRPGINDLSVIDVDADAVSARRDEIIARFNETVINR